LDTQPAETGRLKVFQHCQRLLLSRTVSGVAGIYEKVRINQDSRHRSISRLAPPALAVAVCILPSPDNGLKSSRISSLGGYKPHKLIQCRLSIRNRLMYAGSEFAFESQSDDLGLTFTPRNRRTLQKLQLAQVDMTASSPYVSCCSLATR
jgi:hypothetical protein